MPEPRVTRIAKTRSFHLAPEETPSPRPHDDSAPVQSGDTRDAPANATEFPTRLVTGATADRNAPDTPGPPEAGLDTGLGHSPPPPTVVDRRTGRASTAALTAKTIDVEGDAWLDEPYGLTLTADEIAALTDRPLDTALCAYLDLYHRPRPVPPPWRKRRKSLPAPRGLRYCPLCLAENGAWASDWQNPIVAVCVHHKVLLLDTCPSCGRGPFTDNAWLAQDAPAWTCPSRLNASDPRVSPQPRAHRPWCGHDLRTTRPTPAPSSVVDAQAYLLELARAAAADPQARVTACGLHIPAQIALDAHLQLLEALTPSTALTARSTTRATTIGPRLVPPTEVLTCPDLTTSRRRLGRLLDMASPQAPVAITRDVGARPYNPLVAMLQLTHHASRMTPANQLRLRVGSPAPRYPLPNDARVRKVNRLRLIDAGQHPREPRLEWIPQTLWPGHHLTGVDPRNPTHLAVAALAATRITTTKPFGVLALELGLPSTTANSVGAARRRLHRSGEWQAFLQDLDNLITQLQQHPPPIDYRRRRILGDDTTLLNRALDHALRHPSSLRAPTRDAAATAPPRRREHPRPWPEEDLRRRFWEVFTGGDIAFAPPPLQLDAGSPEYARHALRRPAMDEVHRCCFATAYQLLQTSTAPYLRGPLTWTPP